MYIHMYMYIHVLMFHFIVLELERLTFPSKLQNERNKDKANRQNRSKNAN